MTAFVLDCSVAISWCFEDEATAETDALLDRLCEEGAAAPATWPLELGNVLVMAERRGRITPAKANAFVASIGDLSIAIDDQTAARALGNVLALARSERLTTYDAAYLDLAMRLGVPLATRDAALRRAARNAGAATLPA